MKPITLGLILALAGWPSVGQSQTAPDDFRNFIRYLRYDKVSDIGGEAIEVFKSDGTWARIFGKYISLSSTSYLAQESKVAGAYAYRDRIANQGALFILLGKGTDDVTLTFSDQSRATSEESTSHSSYLRLGSQEEMMNTSCRTFIGAGKSSIAGFVIAGSRSRWVLIRTVGPGLKAYGVANPLADPMVELYGPNADNSKQVALTVEAIPANALSGVTAFIGAFPLAADAPDPVIFVRLNPGVYSVASRSASGTNEGEVLTEVYIFP